MKKELAIKDARKIKRMILENPDYADACATIYSPQELDYIMSYKPLWRKLIGNKRLRVILLAIIAALMALSIIVVEMHDGSIRESDRYERILNIR